MRASFDLPHCVAMPAVVGDGLGVSPRSSGALSAAASLPVPGPDAGTHTGSPIPVVLDTNVWIDILVYNDPASRPIRAALESGRLDAVIDAACLYELDRVLDYPQFARFAIDKTAALATTHALTRQLDWQANADTAAGADGVDMTPVHAAHVANAPVLPRCSDRDDQKFLELAAAGRVCWLVTKDKALLKLTKRFARDFGCRIDRPAGFVAAVLPAVLPVVLPAVLPD